MRIADCGLRIASRRFGAGSLVSEWSVTSLLILLTLTAGAPEKAHSQAPLLPRGGGWREITSVIPDSGRVHLSDPWLIGGSLLVLYEGDTLQPGIDYLWSDSLHSLELLPTVHTSPDDSIRLRYRSAAVTDRLTYYYFTPTSDDTSIITTKHIYPPSIRERGLDPLASWGGIRRSGTLTRGVRFGEGGEGGVTSGLQLELSGRPTTDVTVEAVLDDRNLPASSGGGSVTLPELDRLLFRVTTPHLEARLGDWDLAWDIGRYGSFSRRLKGASAGAQYHALNAEVAVAGGNNSYRRAAFYGRDGDQGPYELTDRFGSPDISVAAGTERVYLNGRLLFRGRRADYVIDYQRGAVTFNPSLPIRSDSRIEVEYEYNDIGYPRYLYAASVQAPGASQEGLTVEAAVAMEGRDDDRPLAFEWSDPWREAAGSAGDNPAGAQVSGVDTVELGEGDYVWDFADCDTILVFSEPDSLGRPTGYLQVDFSPDPTGAYQRIHDDTLQAFHHRWVGEGNGDWSPVRLLPLPDRNSLADLTATYRTGELSIEAELALSNYDRNTMSALDDNDNAGSAWRWSGLWQSAGDLPLTISALARHEDRNFQPLARSVEVDHRYRWDLPEDVPQPETVVESEVALSPLEGLDLAGDAGYLERGDRFTGRRLGLGGNWRVTGWDLSSRLGRVKGDDDSTGQQSSRTHATGTVERGAGRLRPGYTIRMESRRLSGIGPVQGGYRYIEHQTGMRYDLPRNGDVSIGFNYRFDDDMDDGDILHRSDTRTVQAGWRGRRMGGGWSMDLLRYNQTYTDPLAEPVTSTSAALESYLAPAGSPWKARIDYDLRTGNDRASARVASYVGPGRGSYRREGDRFVPDPDGEFELRDVLTDTLRRATRVDFTGQLEWRPRRRKRREDLLETYPLGITGTSGRFEAELTTTADNPWRAFLLDPVAFREPEAAFSRWNWLLDVYFLESHPSGDGKLTLRRDEERDRAQSGGEVSTTEAVSFRLRQRLGRGLRWRAQPVWEHLCRRGIQFGETRSDVTGAGGEVEMTLRPPPSPLEYGILFGYERRRDDVNDASVIERRLSPRLVWNIRKAGTARLEGEWRQLTSSVSSPRYDLTRGWVVGDNWNLTASLDYRLGKNIVATAFYRGRWRGHNRPTNSGLVEFTVRL